MDNNKYKMFREKYGNISVKEANKLQDDFRKKRNEYTLQANLCQNEIDALEILKYDVDKYINQYIKIDTDGNKKIYMHVTDVKRLYKGPKFIGKVISMDENNMFIRDSGYDFSSIYGDDKWGEFVSCVSIISKEEYDKLAAEFAEKVKNI